jgi:hypothetical protein
MEMALPLRKFVERVASSALLRLTGMGDSPMAKESLFETTPQQERVEDFVVGRIGQMRLTPKMWAMTREAFVAQLVVLLEVAGDRNAKTLYHELFGHGSALLGMAEEVDVAFSDKACDLARARFDRHVDGFKGTV